MNFYPLRIRCLIGYALGVVVWSIMIMPVRAGDESLVDLAQHHASTLRFSTLFTAQNVRQFLRTPEGIAEAIQWCRETAVTHVYLETFRDGYMVDRDVIVNAKQRLTEAGFIVSGCVTTTGIGRKAVNGWSFPCFTEKAGRERLKQIFEFTAGLFDEIMIDDFFATQCECEECKQARGDRSWSAFRNNLLMDVSRQDILEPARRVNPNVKVIIKYPQWYEEFHERGYDVVRETEAYDKIWVGTESRDWDDPRWGGRSPYMSYFIMRWLGGIGGAKCGGGWFDPYGTSPPTYLEQARQTVLAGAKEAFLFCYGSLVEQNGPANIEALRGEIPALFQLAELVKGQKVEGICALKPPNSDGDGNRYLYDFVGILGLPLAPASRIDPDAQAYFFPYQAGKDPQALEALRAGISSGKPTLVTQQFAEQYLKGNEPKAAGVIILDVTRDAWPLMNLNAETLQPIRDAMLRPFGMEFEAPTRVSLYLFGNSLVVIENFNDRPVDVRLKRTNVSTPAVTLAMPAESNSMKANGDNTRLKILARSLVVLNY